MPAVIRTACLSLLLVLGACSKTPPPDAGAASAAPLAAAGVLSASAPWLRAVPPNSSVTAGYLTLNNEGDQALQIVAVDSEAAAETMLHSMTMEGGMMQMRMLESLKIPAHGQAVLAPGGTHLMLMGLKTPLAVGSEVTVNFKLDNGQTLSVKFPVREAAP